MKKKLFGSEKREENLLCGAASVLFPTSIFCYFCAQNINEFAALWLIFFMLGALIVLAALTYCISFLVLRRGFLAHVFCVVCWIGCYLEPSMLANTDMDYLQKLICEMLLILIVAALAVYLLRRLKRDMRKPVILFSSFFALILAFNLLPIVRAGFSVEVGTQAEEQLYRTDFSVDSVKTDTPNVYWIHMDGMTSVDVVEKYYHDEQSEFLSDLTAHGFSINPSAHFEGGHITDICIPILMSPYAYDTWISEYAVVHETVMQAKKSYAFLQKIKDVKFHNEMVAAFGKKGYTISAITPSAAYYVPLAGGAYYNIEFSDDRNEVNICSEADFENQIQQRSIRTNTDQISGFLGMLFDKLYKMVFITPPSRWHKELLGYETIGTSKPFTSEMPKEQINQIIPSAYVRSGWSNDRKMIRSLYDILHGEAQDPKLVIIQDLMPHGPFEMDENGLLTGHGDSYNPTDYYPQHVFSAKVLTDMIDMILAVDPDAVIVVQADHGLHMTEEEDFKAAFGEDADALELWNGTMSAICVPKKYQTGEEHYAVENPLNISRYLVNSFVGQNYEYFPSN